MKTVKSLLLLSLLSLLLWGTKSQSFAQSSRKVTREVPISQVRQIEVSDNIIVDLTQGSTESAVVHTTDKLLGYVEVKQEGDKLSIRLKESNPLRRIRKEHYVLVSLTLPSLNSITLTGAAEVRSKGDFETDKLILSLSGGSELKGLRALTKTTIISLSGASELDGSIVGTVSLVASGNSEGNIHIGSAPMVVLSVSGNSEIELSGAANQTKIVASGASEIDADKFRTAEADVVASGSSEVAIAASRKLDYTLSGSSELEVYGRPQISRAQQTGMSEFMLK